MRKKTTVYIILLITTMLRFSITANNKNTVTDTSTLVKNKPTKDKISLLIYERIIFDARGKFRTDQNYIGNFKLVNWLKLEAGIRLGQRPSAFDSYYHYKLELQTKYFFKTVRAIARLSDNVINYPTPSYRKTNKLFAIEAKYPLSNLFQVVAAGGYVFSSQQNKEPNALPTNKGIQNNYPIFKVGIRYIVKDKGFFEAAWGSYDVFNPYILNSPFFQLSTDYDLSHLCSFYSYFRYQYNNYVFNPASYFIAAGIKFHLVKG
jgi:hypothetical protein